MNVTNTANKTFICFVQTSTTSRGIFLGENPLGHRGPTVLLAQLSVSAVLTSALQSLITPFGQTSFVAQTIVGMVLSPSIFGKVGSVRDMIFPLDSFHVCETISYFGLMLFLFIVGVKTDVTYLSKSGKKAVLIGLCSFFIPLALNLAMAVLLLHSVTMGPVLHNSLAWIASFECLNSFYVISCLLHDLKLLNSELGKLAISASMISGTCSWAWSLLQIIVSQIYATGRLYILPQMFVSAACLIAFIVCYLRPILIWIIRRTGEDKAIKEIYIFLVFILVLGCSLLGELIGQHFVFGPMILGLVVPGGPPLGTALVAKLDSFISSILLPIYFVVSSVHFNFSSISIRTFGIVELLALSGFVWKVTAIMVPASLYYKMSVKDAVSLGLIMSAQGVSELILIGRASRIGFIDEESYTILFMSILIISAATTPIVKALYKPSNKYIAHKKRTIQHSKAGAELRLLACIYHEDHTPSIINLLEASNPSPKSPVFFYPVHLIELSGRSAPVLVAHELGKSNSFNAHESDHIINAFRLYEQHNQGTVIMNPFTAISPFETMHDEVCALALDKKVYMVILPFHKFWGIEVAEISGNAARAVNQNILRMAPCSVGILVDRGTLGSNSQKAASRTSYNIGVIFLGGRDDREALAYANRMAKHPNVSISVVRLVDYSISKFKITNEVERDIELINEFRISNARSECCSYKEEVVSDTMGVVNVVRAMENSFDLILVGRRHEGHSVLLHGLQEWNEFPELGFFGDLLSSSDSNCRVSVLVVQQGSAGIEKMIESPKCAILDMSFYDNGKVWPTNSHCSNG